jgi:hypothetical protein
MLSKASVVGPSRIEPNASVAASRLRHFYCTHAHRVGVSNLFLARSLTHSLSLSLSCGDLVICYAYRALNVLVDERHDDRHNLIAYRASDQAQTRTGSHSRVPGIALGIFVLLGQCVGDDFDEIRHRNGLSNEIVANAWWWSAGRKVRQVIQDLALLIANRRPELDRLQGDVFLNILGSNSRKSRLQFKQCYSWCPPIHPSLSVCLSVCLSVTCLLACWTHTL